MNEQLQGRIDGFAAVFCQHFYGYHNRSFDSSVEHSNLSTIGFAVGFVLMMVLDVVMG